jgi:hypothetical protein
MKICPYDYSLCADATCRVEGCKQIGEMMWEICDACGEPVGCVNCARLCVLCVAQQPLRSTAPKKV